MSHTFKVIKICKSYLSISSSKKDDHYDDDSVHYLCAELSSQGPVGESARLKTNARRKQTNKIS
jgi:hypothetical protein